MTRLVVVDDAAAVNDLFARVLEQETGADVVPIGSVGELEHRLGHGDRYDAALVDLSFPEERRTGLEALVAIHRSDATTKLGIITQGDSYVSELLRDAWDVLPICTVLSKSAPIAFQLGQVRTFLQSGTAPVDPSILPLLPATRAGTRGMNAFARLVGHVGHAKLWSALFEELADVSYQHIVKRTGLRLNTVKNYRTQLLPELAHHGLIDPSLKEMHEFAVRCRPILEVHIEETRRRSRSRDEV